MNNDLDRIQQIREQLQEALRLVGNLSISSAPAPSTTPNDDNVWIDPEVFRKEKDIPGTKSNEIRQKWVNKKNELAKTPGTKEYEERQEWIAKQNRAASSDTEEGGGE